MDALAAQVAKNTDAEASAIVVLNDLAGRIAAVAGDKPATLALAATLKSSADALSAAIVANTSAA
jgi:hypothetical protein